MDNLTIKTVIVTPKELKPIKIFKAIKERSETLDEQRNWYDKLKGEWNIKDSTFSRKIRGISEINYHEWKLACTLLNINEWEPKKN